MIGYPHFEPMKKVGFDRVCVVATKEGAGVCGFCGFKRGGREMIVVKLLLTG